MNSADRPLLHGLLLSVVSGILLFLSFPPADCGWIAFVALAPLLGAARRARPGHAALCGLVAGVTFFLPLLHWILGVMMRYGNLTPLLAAPILLLLVAYLAAYFAAAAALVSAAAGRWGWRGLLVAPFAWVGLETVRGSLLTGFPWGLVAYSQWRHLDVLQIASLGGVAALSLVVLLANTAGALLFEAAPEARRHGDAPRIAAAGLLLVVVAACVAGHRLRAAWDARDAAELAQRASLRVAAIQANVAQDRKWRREEEESIVDDLLRLTGQAARDGAALVVWPESSSPLSFYRPVWSADGAVAIEARREFLDRVTDLVRREGLTLIAGSVDYRHEQGRLRAYNSAFVVSPDGTVGPAYDKMHLVPFGEYVPLSQVLFFVDRMVQGAIAEFAPGERLRPLPTPAGAAATFVCYEAIFPDQVRRLARGASFLVNLTNDAWFGKSAAPRQHLAMAVVRAVENRLWLLRAANTGISALVDPCGRVRATTERDVQVVLSGRLVPRAGASLYVRTGEALAWACVIVTAGLAAALRAAFFTPRASRRGASRA